MGVPESIIRNRISAGWSVSKAIDTPCKPRDRRISHLGETKTVREWAEIAGIGHDVLRGRLRRGWTMEQTLSTPKFHSPKR